MELLEIALGPNPKRGEITHLINQAIHRKLPDVIRELKEEKRRNIEAVKAAVAEPSSVQEKATDQAKKVVQAREQSAKDK